MNNDRRINVAVRILSLVLLSTLGATPIFTNVQAQEITPQSPFHALKTAQCKTDEVYAIAVHGGAVFRPGNYDLELMAVDAALRSAGEALSAGARAIDVVEAVIAEMENSGTFNAGKGAIANQEGVVEMDASIMEGRLHKAGAVASIEATRNPISAARMVMEQSRHVMLVGPDADEFVKNKGGEIIETTYFLHGGHNFNDVPLPNDINIIPVEDNQVSADKAAFSGTWAGTWPDISLNHVLVVEEVGPDSATVIYALGPDPMYAQGKGMHQRLSAKFVNGGLEVVEPAEMGGHTLSYKLNADGTLNVRGVTPDNSEVYRTTLQRLPPKVDDHDGGTVGAVARDRCGDLAAGTSTGGFDAKTPGRVGDSPIIGAGTYADNETAAISATGHGEMFIRYVVAHEISAAMKYKGLSLEDAATHLIEDELIVKKVRGGIIAVDREGNISMPYNTEGMVRGSASNTQAPKAEVF